MIIKIKSILLLIILLPLVFSLDLIRSDDKLSIESLKISFTYNGNPAIGNCYISTYDNSNDMIIEYNKELKYLGNGLYSFALVYDKYPIGTYTGQINCYSDIYNETTKETINIIKEEKIKDDSGNSNYLGGLGNILPESIRTTLNFLIGFSFIFGDLFYKIISGSALTYSQELNKGDNLLFLSFVLPVTWIIKFIEIIITIIEIVAISGSALFCIYELWAILDSFQNRKGLESIKSLAYYQIIPIILIWNISIISINMFLRIYELILKTINWLIGKIPGSALVFGGT